MSHCSCLSVSHCHHLRWVFSSQCDCRDDRHRSSKRHYESGSSDDEYGGYVPRKRQEPPAPGTPEQCFACAESNYTVPIILMTKSCSSHMLYAIAAVGYSTSYIDPYAALRNKSGIVSQDPKESKPLVLSWWLYSCSPCVFGAINLRC